MSNINYENLVKEIKKKLNFPDIKFPDITSEEVEFNAEMIGIENEDWILLYREGFIGPLQLADLLGGKKWGDVI